MRNHKYTSTLGGAAVAAVKAGTDLTCGTEYRTLVDEVKAGRITEAEINRSLERLFVARFRLGMFDPPERVPYSKISISENDSQRTPGSGAGSGAEGDRASEERERGPSFEPVHSQNRRHRSFRR